MMSKHFDKKNRIRNLTMGLVVILSLVFTVALGMGTQVKAAPSANSSIVQKAVFEGVYGCFKDGNYAASFMATDVNSFATDGDKEAVKLPYGVTDINDNNLNCSEVMLGYRDKDYSGIKGGLSIARVGSTKEEVKNYFAGTTTNDSGLPAAGGMATSTTGGLGYTAKAISEGTVGAEKTLVFEMDTYNCANGETNPTFNGKTTITFPTVSATDSGFTIVSMNDIKRNGVTTFQSTNCHGTQNIEMTVEEYDDSNSMTLDIMGVGIDGAYHVNYNKDRRTGELSITTNGNIGLSTPNGESGIHLTPRITEVAASGAAVADYELNWGGGNVMEFLRKLNRNNRVGYSLQELSSNRSYDGLALTKQEVFDLYVYYINDVFKAKLVSEDSDNFGGVDINLCSNKKWKVDKSGAQSVSPVYGVNSSYHFNATVTLDDVINTLNALGTFDNINNGGRCNSNGNTGISPGGIVTSTDGMNCDDLNITDGKIGAMQWILCPTMDNTRHTASWIDEHVKDWLTTDASLYSNNAVTQVWGFIRNIANVAMVVFLLVIILSQLTGRGIDNYGIKKMLPRLIVMAIIVNLSLYICQLAADLSNIAGTGLNGMFSSIGDSINPNTSGESFIGGMTVGLFAAAAGSSSTATAAGLAAISISETTAVALIVVVIAVFLVIAVALMVFALMLGARQIIVIVCVVLSPLAFAAFILPNTQSLFKKWWDLFKAALIIFPICGAMGGISYLLRAMAQSGQINLGVGGNIIMMVLPYLVFFLLPTLLKNAISALGKVGGALTALGNTVRNGGRQLGQAGMRAAQNSQRYKDMQKEAARRQEQQRVNRVMRRFGNGSDIEQRLQDARNRMANAQQGTREYSVAERDLRRAQTDQRQFYEAQQAHYRLEAEQQVAGTSPDVLAARAQSTQESLEFKNVSDQFANASTDQIQVALVSAENAYGADRNSTNATRLRAMQAVAMNKGLNSDVLRGLNRLNLDNGNENDQKVLNSVNYSNLYSGLTRSELGTELQDAVNAYGADRNASNMNRLQNIIKAADSRGMDKEMLTHLGGLSLQANDANGRATNDARILDTMSGVNNKVVKQYGIQMGKPANVQQNMTMNQFADSTGPVKLSETLAGKGEGYLNDTNDDTLGYIATHSMSGGAYNPVISAGTLANITANTTDEKVLREARKIYNNMNADDISFSGNQLAKYDLETLQQLATRVKPNSQLQRNFVAATNDIAKNTELMSVLKPEQRAMFKAIRRGAGINDNLFD